MNAVDKAKLAVLLDEFGMSIIEGGWPTVYTQDKVFFRRAQNDYPASTRAKLVAMAPAPTDDAPEEAPTPEEANAQLLKSKSGHVGLAFTLLGIDNSWLSDTSVEQTCSSLKALKAGLDEREEEGGKVVLQAHNFFDAWREDRAKCESILNKLLDCGVGVLLLVDSGGGATPWEIGETTKEAAAVFGGKGALVGVGCKDNSELAVASSLYGVKSGAEVVMGAVNGYDSCADLTSIIPILQLKTGRTLVAEERLAGLTKLSRAVDEQVNSAHRINQPFVGQSAFAHKGGIHVAAVLKNEDSYQHINPVVVGNERRVLISELSGRGNIMSKVEEFGMLGQSGGGQGKNEDWKQRSGGILKTVKDLEQKGYTFEGADASVDLMIRRSMPAYRPAFTVVESMVDNRDVQPTTERVRRWTQGGAGDYSARERARARCTAVVKVAIDKEFSCLRRDENCGFDDDDGHIVLEVSEGNGPVDALAKALDRALLPSFPSLACVGLCDYKVRILDGDKATGAVVRVMIEFQLTGAVAKEAQGKGKKLSWTTVSAGPNIISTSFAALVDGYEFHLAEHVNLDELVGQRSSSGAA